MSFYSIKELKSVNIYCDDNNNIKINKDSVLILLGSSQNTIETWGSSQNTIETWGSSQNTINLF